MGNKAIDDPKVYTQAVEQLAVAQAVYKAVASVVGTKDPDNLRGVVDDKVISMYQATGAKSFDIKVKGSKVGSISVRLTKPKKGKTVVVTDRDAFEEWALGEGLAHLETKPTVVMDEDAILHNALNDGEIPNGCTVVDVDEPEKVTGTTLRGCDPLKVSDALGDGFEDKVMGLLEGDING